MTAADTDARAREIAAGLTATNSSVECYDGRYYIVGPLGAVVSHLDVDLGRAVARVLQENEAVP